MSFIMIGLLLREALDRLFVRLNMYLVSFHFVFHFEQAVTIEHVVLCTSQQLINSYYAI